MHICSGKQRDQDKNLKHVQLAFMVYQRFWASNYRSAKPRTYDQFAQSQFYTAFVKFARYMIDIKVINPHDFVDFVIKTGVKIDEWHHQYVYTTYVRELVKKESADAAMERTFGIMQEWAKDSGNEWTEFFALVPTTIATHWIKSGWISPWVLYTAKGSPDLFSRMSPEQFAIIQEALDPKFWEVKLEKQ